MSRPSLLRLIALADFVQRRTSGHRFQHIRESMLLLLEPYASEQISHVRQRVRFAQDLEALWYLRQDLVLVLTEYEGDETARKRTLEINRSFQGRLPSTMRPRLHRRFDSERH